MQILEAAKKRKIKTPYENSIQDLSLVIGVWTDKLDSLDTEVYSLKVHQPNDDLEVDIIEANTDQKTLCNPVFVSENLYRCLFMVTYDDEDVDLEMPILIYGKSLNHSAITKTYASFVERELYDTFNLDELRKVYLLQKLLNTILQKIILNSYTQFWTQTKQKKNNIIYS